MNNVIRKLLLPVFFVLITLGFFYQTVSTGKLPIPSDTLIGLYHPWRDLYAKKFPRGMPFKNFLITDPIRQQIPWRKTAVEAWKSGMMPALNPYAFTGVPLDANIQTGAFYPLNFLFLVLEFPIAWTVLIMLQPFLSMFFMYAYLRKLRVSVPASVAGSLAWTFSGFSVSWLTWGTIVHTALWLPLMLYAVESLTDTTVKNRIQALKHCLVLALAVSMTVLAGHIQVAAYVLGCTVLYALWKIRRSRLYGAALPREIRNAVLLSFGVGLGVSAIQWVRLVGYMPLTGRISDATRWMQAGWFLPWQHLIQFFVPDFFGNPTTLNYWGVWNYGELIGYIGLIPIAFALSAMGFGGIPGFFTLLAFCSLMSMLSGPLSSLPYRLHVPVFSSLQPTRLMVMVDFSLAVLSAYGIDAFMRGKRKRIIMAVMTLTMLLLVGWILTVSAPFIFRDAGYIQNMSVAKRNLFIPTVLLACLSVLLIIGTRIGNGKIRVLVPGLLLCVIIADLFRFGWKYTPFTLRADFFPPTKITEYLSLQEKPFRIMSMDDRIMPPNVSAYYGIETVEGYDPLAPRAYEEYLLANEHGMADFGKPSGYNRIYTIRNTDSSLFPYLNVRYILSLGTLTKPYLREVMSEGETILYEYSGFIPRVFLAEKTIRVSDEKSVLETLIKTPISRIAVYTDPLKIMDAPLTTDETAQIRSFGQGQIRIHTETRNARLLVVGNRFDDRWAARLDDTKPLTIVPVNYLFMGITIPGGSHDIILTYR